MKNHHDTSSLGQRRLPASGRTTPARRRTWLWSLALWPLLLALTASADDITIRLSVKAVLNPANGMRQPGVSEAVFANTVTGMNAMLKSYGRGYVIQWNGTLINVGGAGQFQTGPSRWYDVNFRTNSALKDVMEAQALADPEAFAWDANAVNIYITRYGGANWNVCSFPDDNIILLNGMAGYSTASTVLHEIGHYFNLSHTMNGQKFLNSNGTTCTNRCDCSIVIGGGKDGVADTKLDNECWDDRDKIAQGNFAQDYDQLSSGQKRDVNRIWFNIMSYHGRHNTVDLLTPDQLDRWTDTANTSRLQAVSGRTWFVDANNTHSALPSGNSKVVGGYGGPYPTVQQGVSQAGPRDIVLIRAGTYSAATTFNRPMVLRASRGNAVLE